MSRCLVAAAGAVLLLVACGSAPKRDLEFDRLHASLQALSSDPELAKLALPERALADAAVRQLDASSVNAGDHAHLAYIAERRVDIAYIAAQTERESARLSELEREHAQLLLAASRQETALAREALEQQRRRELMQAEQQQAAPVAPATAIPGGTPPAPAPAASATQPAAIAAASSTATSDATAAAEPAAPSIAAPTAAATAPDVPAAPSPTPAATLTDRLRALVVEPSPAGAQMTLEDLAFEPGTAVLVAEAEVGMQRLAAFVATEPQRAIRIEGHTDATGSVDANLLLSQRRAEAVRDALVARGVERRRIEVIGKGESQPVASNDEAPGRARNRRVVVVLVTPG